MRLYRVMFLLTCFLVSGEELAQGAPSCSGPLKTDIQINYCAGKADAKANQKLNQVYQSLIQKMKSSGNGSMIPELRESEISWLHFRQKFCYMEGSQFQGGSIQPMIENNCDEALTKQQAANLADLEKSLSE